MFRWFAAVACGLLGGIAAHQLNYLFPGSRTSYADWLGGLLLFSLVGMLVGAIPLAFPLKLRMTAIFSFILSAAFSWWIIVNVFR